VDVQKAKVPPIEKPLKEVVYEPKLFLTQQTIQLNPNHCHRRSIEVPVLEQIWGERK
jgi:hypothetical protein